MTAGSTIANHPLQEDFEHFFEQSLCGYLTLSSKSKIVRVNGPLAGWVGKNPEELVGSSFSDLLSVGGKIYYETHLFPLLRMQGHFDEIAMELSALDGKRLQVLANAYEHRDENGTPQFIRVTLSKAADRQIYEQNLRTARDLAEGQLTDERETSALREQFIAVLSHDLRNPVGAIYSGATLLNHSPLSARDKTLVAMMKDSATRMTELIENVMDFARARLGGGMPVNLQPTFLEPVLHHVVDELRSAYPKRAIETKLSIPDAIICDGSRISQLLSNLLANALTHGAPDSSITVRAFSSNGDFEMWVSNGGVPLPPESLKRLFQPFTREDAHSSQNGLGLGLYISSEIARAHGGELKAASSETETRFTFRMRTQSKV